MKDLKKYLDIASKKYNSNKKHADECRALISYALNKLISNSDYGVFGDFQGKPVITYNAFSNSNEISRPVRPDLFILDENVFISEYDLLINSLSKPPSLWGSADINRANIIVYTGVMAIACCYDLWQKGSRKTPGTFFEIFMASLLQEMLPEEVFSKHIPLTSLLGNSSAENKDDSIATDEDNASSVSTDIVIRGNHSNQALVVPLKITTRERIVQPFAHQRILDSAFGEHAFTSFVVCISETQQDKKKSKVNHICVPGTIKLFQQYLAPVGGLYYCDVPPRYLTKDMQSVIAVKSVGNFFIDAYEFFENHKRAN